MEQVENNLENLIGKIDFQKITDNNLFLLYECRNEIDFLSNLTSRKQLESFEQFKEEIQRDFKIDRHCQFLVFFKGNFIGTVYSYNYNKYDNYCFVSLYTTKKYQGKGIGVLSTILFCKQLFEELKIFKVYLDVYEYNEGIISVLKKRQISLEGIFKNQHLFDKKRYDVLRFALYEPDIQKWIINYT